MGKPAAIQPFKQGDVVMAMDNGKAYEAKILKCQKSGAVHKYFIHYQGWGRKYDTWLDSSQITPCISKQKIIADDEHDTLVAETVIEDAVHVEEEIVKPHRKGTRGASAAVESVIATSSSSSSSGATSQSSAFKKQKREMAVQDLTEDDPEDTLKLKIPIPPSLKRHLVDEWTFITNEPKKLSVLPRGPTKTVHALMKDYLSHNDDKVRVQIYNK